MKHKQLVFLIFVLYSTWCWASKIKISGSSTVAPLVSELAKRFEKNRGGIRIDVQTGGSSRGIYDIRQGLVDIGMISRQIKNHEHDLHQFTIAHDGIGLITHQSNPISELNSKQVVAIFKGELASWKKLTGVNSPITVVNKAEGRSTLELFLKFFKLKNQQIKSHIIIGDNEQGIKTVSGNPHAIGFVSIGTAEYNIALGVPIKLIKLNGHKASTANIKNGSYPLKRSLNLVVNRQPSKKIKDFLAFAQSKDVHDLVEKQFFIPIQK